MFITLENYLPECSGNENRPPWPEKVINFLTNTDQPLILADQAYPTTRPALLQPLTRLFRFPNEMLSFNRTLMKNALNQWHILEKNLIEIDDGSFIGISKHKIVIEHGAIDLIEDPALVKIESLPCLAPTREITIEEFLTDNSSESTEPSLTASPQETTDMRDQYLQLGRLEQQLIASTVPLILANNQTYLLVPDIFVPWKDNIQSFRESFDNLKQLSKELGITEPIMELLEPFPATIEEFIHMPKERPINMLYFNANLERLKKAAKILGKLHYALLELEARNQHLLQELDTIIRPLGIIITTRPVRIPKSQIQNLIKKTFLYEITNLEQIITPYKINQYKLSASLTAIHDGCQLLFAMLTAIEPMNRIIHQTDKPMLLKLIEIQKELGPQADQRFFKAGEISGVTPLIRACATLIIPQNLTFSLTNLTQLENQLRILVEQRPGTTIGLSLNL